MKVKKLLLAAATGALALSLAVPASAGQCVTDGGGCAGVPPLDAGCGMPICPEPDPD